MSKFSSKLLSMYCRNTHSLYIVKWNVFLPEHSVPVRNIITPHWSSSIHIHNNQLYRTFTRKGITDIDIVEFK